MGLDEHESDRRLADGTYRRMSAQVRANARVGTPAPIQLLASQVLDARKPAAISTRLFRLRFVISCSALLPAASAVACGVSVPVSAPGSTGAARQRDRRGLRLSRHSCGARRRSAGAGPGI